MSVTNLVAKTQKIIVNPATQAVGVISAGPVGPAGPPGSITRMPGEIIMWAGSTTPAGWSECDFGELSRLGNAALFAEIGTTYGPGDGVNTFNKPDMRGRVPMGIGTGVGLTTRARGDKVGAETHALTPAQTAVKGHGHTFTGSSATSATPSSNTSGTPSNNTSGTPSDNTSNDNAGQDHTHSLSGHQHYEQHYHGLGGHTHSGNTGGQSANHTHGGWDNNQIVGWAGTTSSNISTGGGGYANAPTTNWANQDHGHSFSTGGPSGGSDWSTRDWTDGPNINATGGISALHTHGLKNHTHTLSNHTHDLASHTHTLTANGTVSTLADGANGTAHNIMQPSLGVRFIIKL